MTHSPQPTERFAQHPRLAERLFDDDLTGRSPKTLVDALADRNQAFFAHEVAMTATRAAS